MAPQLGIVTRYLRNEVTHAAIHLAEITHEHGIRSTIFGAGHVCRDVAKRWDAEVVTAQQCPLVQWAAECDHIVYTYVPSPREIAHVQHLGVRTTILVNWEVLLPTDRAGFTSFDNVIFPFRCVAKAIQKHWPAKLPPSVVMPWDVPVGLTTRDPLELRDTACAYFPLYDTQPGRCDQSIFALMQRVLLELENTRVLIACGGGWSQSSKRALRQLHKKFGDRVEIVMRPNILQRLLLFARADLTVWPSRFESFALIGLYSLCMGTPVLSWDIRPQNEYLENQQNAILIPARTRDNWLGVPEVTGRYQDMADGLVGTLRDGALLAKMKKNTTTGLASRRKQFEAGWAKLFL